jgi:tetratricopeptide (TPR) repeat protein
MMKVRTSFVGRQEHLGRLEAALAEASTGAPRVVLVGGDAGVGKTRLVTEFSIRAQQHGARTLTGGCYELSAGGLPYGPIVEALRGMVRVLDAAARRERLDSVLAELLTLLPIGEGPHHSPEGPSTGTARARLFELLLALLDQLGRVAPVVLVVEDLHWADQSTLDLLVFWLHNLRDERIMVVGTYRTDEPHGQDPLQRLIAEADRNALTQRFELSGFDRTELAEQLGGLLGTAPPAATVERILARSEGNPFFAEELLVADMEGSSGPPRGPRDLVMRRVNALSDDVRDALGVVAAAERKLSHRLLAAAYELPERTLLQALRVAVSHRLLVSDAETGTYSFRHELAREAIYAELLPGERMRFHAAIARAISEYPTLAGGQDALVAAELAHHWHAAHDSPKALAASVVAGQAAAGIYAFSEAQRQLERALALWQRVPDAAVHAGLTRGELLEQAADSSLWAGDIDRAIALVQEALAGTDPVREAVRAGALHERLGSYLWRWGDNERSVAVYAEANRLLANQGASPERARAIAGYGRALVIAGLYSEARARSEEAVAMARTIGARQVEGYALNYLGISRTMTGDPEGGIAALRETQQIAREASSFDDLKRACANLSWALEHAGRLPEAAETVLAGLELARELHLEFTAGAILLLNAADLLFQLGRWTEMDELIRDAHRLEASARFGPYLCQLRGELSMALGQFDQADENLETARGTSPRLTDSHFLGALHACLAELACWRGRHDAARAAVHDGLELLAGTEEEQLALRLCAIGMRALADKATAARTAGKEARVAATREAGAALIARSAELIRVLTARGRVLPAAHATMRLVHAEYARLEERDGAEGWEAVAAAWRELQQPYRAAYAHWRQAESLAHHGGGAAMGMALGRAYDAAIRLGARPLQEQLEVLAGQHDVELQRPPVEAGR